jgi:hypothetical protein
VPRDVAELRGVILVDVQDVHGEASLATCHWLLVCHNKWQVASDQWLPCRPWRTPRPSNNPPARSCTCNR